MDDRRLLFICTHNRCRSILCESIARKLGFTAASAGSAPAGAIFPMTLTMLEAHGYPTDGLSSESWENKSAYAPTMVITVCDSAAGETCPLWMGDVPRRHWGLEDPSKITDVDEQKTAFDAVISSIEQRLNAMRDYNTAASTHNPTRPT